MVTLDELFELIDRQARHVKSPSVRRPYRKGGEPGMEEENALGSEPTELSVSCPERVNDVETFALGL